VHTAPTLEQQLFLQRADEVVHDVLQGREHARLTCLECESKYDNDFCIYPHSAASCPCRRDLLRWLMQRTGPNRSSR
jgi:hypothetical protein